MKSSLYVYVRPSEIRRSAFPSSSAAAKPEQKPVTLTALQSLFETTPTQQATALSVFSHLDDENSCAASVAARASLDPTLVARVMRMANSAYYGMSGRVTTLPLCISIVGFDAVRALVAAALTGAGSSDQRSTAFWRRAAATGAAARLVAPYVKAQAAEALCAGMLSNLGELMFSQHDPDAYPDLLEECGKDVVRLRSTEKSCYGFTHDEAAAGVLQAWRFPSQIVLAVAEHHNTASTQPLCRAVRAAGVLAAAVTTGETPTEMDTAVPKEHIASLLKKIREDAAGLHMAIAG